MSIDKNLLEQLKKRGMHDKIKELEDLYKESKMSRLKVVKEVPSAIKKIGATVIDTVFPLIKTTGESLAVPSTIKLQKEASKQQSLLETQTYKQLNSPNISRKNKQRILNSLSKTNPDIISNTPLADKTPKQVMGETITTGVNAVLLGKAVGGTIFPTKSIVGTKLASASRYINTLGKSTEIGKTGIQLEQSLGPRIAGSVLRGLTLGTEGAIFGLGTGMESGKENKEVAKEAGVFAAANVFVPPLLGRALKMSFKTIRNITKEAGYSSRLTSAYLEDYAENSLSKKTGNIFVDSARPAPATIKQTFAKMGSNILEKGNKPLETTMTDRLFSLKRIDDVQERLTGNSVVGTPQSAYETARIYAGVPEGTFTVAAHDYTKLFETKYASINNKETGYLLEGYMKGLDELNRASMGMRVEGGKTINNIKKSLIDIESKVIKSQGNLDILNSGVKEFNGYIRENSLDILLKKGLISKERYDSIRGTYKNYVPNLITDFFEMDAKNAFLGSGRSMNVSNNLVEAAKGSVRDKAPTKLSVLYKIDQAITLGAKNDVMHSIIDPARKTPEAFGFTALRTAEQVEARNLLYEGLQENLSRQVENLKGVKTLQEIEKARVSSIEKIIKDTETNIKDITKNVTENIKTTTKQEVSFLKNYLLESKTKLTNIFNQVETKDISTLKKKLITTGKEMDDLFSEAQTLGAEFEPPSTIMSILRKVDTREKKTFLLTDKLEQSITDYNYNAAKIIKRQSEALSSVKQGIKNIKDTTDIRIKKEVSDKISKINTKITSDIKRQSGVITRIKNTKKSLQNIVKERADDIKTVKNILKEMRDVAVKPVDYTKEGLEKVSMYTRGIREDWLVPTDIAEAIKNTSGTQVNLPKWMTAPARTLRSFATQKNISFSLTNFPKDVQNAAVIGEYGINPAILEDAFYNIMDLDNPQTRKWFKGGGAFGGLMTAERPVKDILSKQNINPLFKKPIKLGEIIESIGERYENTTRKAVYDTAISKGASTHKAIWESRNATVDFSKMGTTIGVLNQIVPFLNARVQGLSNSVNRFVKEPEAMLRKQMMWGAYPSALLYAHNSKYESYPNIPQYEKNSYWNIMYAEEDGFDKNGTPVTVPKYISIKKGEAAQPVANLTEFYLTKSKGENKTDTNKFLVQMLKDTSPVGAAALGPITIPFELAANYNLFTGAPIEPNYQALTPGGLRKPREQVDVQLRATNWTGETAKNLSKMGLDKIGLSPANIEFVVGKIFATPGNDLLKIIDIPQSTLDKTSIKNSVDKTAWQTVSNMPILRSFLGSSVGAEKIFLYNTLEEINKDITMGFDYQKEIQAQSLYQMAKEIGKTKGNEAADNFLINQNTDKDMMKRINRIHKNRQKGESYYKQVYDQATSNRAKVLFLVEVLNMTESKQKKDQIISDVKASSNVIKELNGAIKAGVLKKPTAD